jgi:hypothetical protein
MVEFSNNRKEEMDDYECTCSYYDNIDNCCPHIYALLCHIFKVAKEESKFNIDRVSNYKNMNVSKIKKEYDKGNLDIIDLDLLGYNYEELFPDRNNDPLLDRLDKFIESMPLEVLEKARKETLLEGEDTRIFDKAINNKIAYQKKLEKEKKKERKEMRRILFKGFFDGLFGGSNESFNSDFNHDLSSWEKEELNKGNYDPWNFEEEELEEDDYYYEDDE